MNNNRAMLIAEIIEKRQKRAGEFRHIKPILEELKSALESVESYRQSLDKQTEIAIYLEGIDFSEEITQIQRKTQEIDNLIQRLDRETLNIGVLGRMGQGKSRLLQSITGLDNATIPSSDQSVCTSTLSKIYHRPNAADVTAEVEFYSWTSFRSEVIGLYYRSLDLGPVPTTPSEFKNNRPHPLPEEKKRDQNSKYLYGRLCKEYQQNFSKYERLLTGAIQRDLSREEIRRYVTQDDRNESGDRRSYDDLSVKEVRIYCQFGEAEDVGRIGLIDLPGLGDNNLYDLARLTKALKQDVDFLLFVRRPDTKVHRGWEQADRDLFNTAIKTLDDFPVSECSYMVINRFRDGDANNDEKIEEFCKRFKESIHQHQIKVKDTVIVDCSDAQDVKLRLLDPILNDLVNNMDKLFDDYLRDYKQNLIQLRSRIQEKLEIALNVLESYGGNENTSKFLDWFDEKFLPNLTGGLQKEVTRLWQKRDTEDTEFKAKVIEALNKCRHDDVLPSIEDIDGIAANSTSYKVAFYQCLLPIKLNLTNYLDELNYEIERLLRQVRLSVASVLCEQAGLEALLEKQEDELLQELKQQLPESFTDLKKGFEDILNYTASYTRPVSWVQTALEKLNPDDNIDPISEYELMPGLQEKTQKFWTDLPPDQQFQFCSGLLEVLRNAIQPAPIEIKSLTFVDFILGQVLKEFGQSQSNQLPISTNTSKTEQVRQALHTHRNKVVDECQEILESKLNEPNLITHSMVSQFTIQISSPKAKRQWQVFLTHNQDKMWDGAKDQATRADVARRWKELVNFAREISQSDELLFLG